MTTTFTPTDEQLHIVDLARSGKTIAVDAFAGAAKTTSLVLIGQALRQQGAFIAYNKAIANDAKARLPRNVSCSTAHSLAFRQVGHRYAHRLNAPRMKSWEIAKRLGIDPVTVTFSMGRKVLSPPFLGSLAMRSVQQFCQSADDEIGVDHVPVPRAAKDDREMLLAYREIAAAILPAMRRAWADVASVDGTLPYTHDSYFKSFQLSHPQLPFDFMLVDEAQDVWPALLALVEDQRTFAQVVIVGDARQQIYQWRGSLDAMSVMPVDARGTLSRSFRFGAEIAEVANDLLASLGAPTPMVGGGPPGVVGPIEQPDLVLARTNATTVAHAFREIEAGGHPHVVGGADDVVSFARGALDLQAGRASYHPELACFDTWGEVVEYARIDELGGDLALFVSLVEQFGAQRIIDMLASQPPESRASVVLSTAHKFKGRESASVRLAGDFADLDEDWDTPEACLEYVALTRAKTALDITAAPWLIPDREPVEV